MSCGVRLRPGRGQSAGRSRIPELLASAVVEFDPDLRGMLSGLSPSGIMKMQVTGTGIGCACRWARSVMVDVPTPGTIWARSVAA